MDISKLKKLPPYNYVKSLQKREEWFFSKKEGILQTFDSISIKTPSKVNINYGCEVIDAFKIFGVIQIYINDEVKKIGEKALEENKKFAISPTEEKIKLISERSYSGYVGSGDEVTDGVPDGSEIFTITKDIQKDDPRYLNNWPCHGQTPWPNESFKKAMNDWMHEMGKIADNLLKAMALGLGVDINSFLNLTQDGWHHMRVLNYKPKKQDDNKIGIGAHTDYGMLVLAIENMMEPCLSIRPPVDRELRLKNWQAGHSMAGMYAHEDPWILYQAVPNTIAVFPGDMFQLLTNGELLSTPHKVKLPTEEIRNVLAYFHEPNFESVIKTLPKFLPNGYKADEMIYGKHFTNMYMRCYPHWPVTKHIKNSGANKSFLNN